MSGQSMRAVVVAAGAAGQVELTTLPVPTPAPDEVLVRVRAVAVNRMDLMMAQAGSKGERPFVLGGDAVAEVVSAPSGGELAPGRRVSLYPAHFCGACPACLDGHQTLCRRVSFFGLQRSGTFAEFMAVPARCLLPIDDALADVDAAALPVAYLTAWNMLFGPPTLRPEETVLIQGIGGGVSAACLQLAVMVGARAIVTSSSAEKLARATTLGAWAGIDYLREDVAKRTLELTGGRGVDLVIDNVGEQTFQTSLRSVRAGGRIASCGVTGGATASLPLPRLFARQITVRGVTLGTLQQLRALLAVAATGRVRPVVDGVLPLERAGEALARMTAGQKFGKLVLTL